MSRLRNSVIFNGILTGNCVEIMEYSDDKSYATCNLCVARAFVLHSEE